VYDQKTTWYEVPGVLSVSILNVFSSSLILWK